MSRVPLHKREEVVQLSLKGYTQRNVANLTDCNVSTVNRIVQAYRDEGRIKDAQLEGGGLEIRHLLRRIYFLETLGPAEKSVAHGERTLLSAEHRGSGRTSVNVWAAISHDGLSPLLKLSGKFTSAAYCKLFEHEMIPYVLNGPHMDGCYLFQQDLSPVHTAKEVARILDERGAMRLEWCAKGADTSIIEHVLARMKANLSRLSLDLVTADELWEARQEEWKRIQADTSFIAALYRSLPERMDAVIQAGGAMTCY